MSDALRDALERAHAFRTAARALAVPADPAALAGDLEAWRQRAQGALGAALARAQAALAEPGPPLADEHERLLGGRGGSVSCRETSYADARRIAPTDLADVVGFLEAFGLQPAGAPPDHVCSECELASVLALKEAYALGEGWAERAEIARRAYEELFADHLARWLPRFAERLGEASEGGFYAAVAEALGLWVRAEAARLDVALDSDAGPVVSVGEADAFACGDACGPSPGCGVPPA
jgi:TorA maturation chaperone TorD